MLHITETNINNFFEIVKHNLSRTILVKFHYLFILSISKTQMKPRNLCTEHTKTKHNREKQQNTVQE